jgi:uncharacterized repeat protein (TIGR01451 family)
MSVIKTRILAIAAGVLLAAGTAHAAGTTAGTSISNQASVGYTVGGVSQPTVNSNTVTFVADRRINLAVAEVGGAYTDVAPGSTDQVLTFTVTNTTNAPLDFALSATQDTTGTNDFLGNADDFDGTNLRIFVDSNGNNTYDVGTDVATFLDEVGADATRTVFVVSDIPLGQANGDSAGVTLTATAAEPGTASALGATVTETAGADTAGSIDTVFGDGAGDTDAARDGKHSDDDAYRIQTATLTVTKTSTVISDPFNGVSPDAKRIPGAVIEYCIVVQNSGSVPATSVVLTDVLTGQPVTYVASSIYTEDGTTCAGGVNEDDDNAGVDESPNGGAQSGGTVSGTFSSVAAGAGKALRFRVTIN